MKIAMVHPSLNIKGGAENVVIWLAESLVNRGHEVTIFTTDYDETYYGGKKNKPYKIEILPLGGYAISIKNFFVAGFLLHKKLVGYDLVNPHNFPSYIWCYLAKKFNPKIQKIVWFCEEPLREFYRDIIDEHVNILKQQAKNQDCHDNVYENTNSLTRFKRLKKNFNFTFSRRLDRFVVPRLDLILTNSQYTADIVEKIFHFKVKPCLLGVPHNRFSQDLEKIRDGKYLLTVSRLNPEKNVENIIRAVGLLVGQNKFPFKKYYVAGEGPLRDSLKKLVSDLKLTEVVEILGFVRDEELTKLYLEASVVIYIPVDETYGLVFPEAAYYKKPVIGPNQGGPKELVLNGQTGLQVDPLDVESIATGLLTIMKMDRVGIGVASRQNYLEHLTFEKFVDRFIKLTMN